MATRLHDDPGLAGLVSQLATDAREVASAEVGLQKARLLDTVTRYKGAAVMFVVAGVLGLAALVALLVGLIATASRYVGPGFATTIVVGATMLLAGIFALIGKSRLAGGGVTS